MKKFFVNIAVNWIGASIVAITVLIAQPTPALADSCDAIAARIAASQRAQVLGVSSRKKGCRIRLLVKRPNRPPKRKTIFVRK